MTAAVLFDLDGTLIDPREGIVACLSHALRELGRATPPSRALERCIGPPLRESFRTLLGTVECALIEAAVALYRQRFSSTGILEHTVYAGVRPALADLRARGATLYVVTSKPRVFAERIVKHIALEDAFRGVHGSELDGRRDDKGELIAHVLEVESLSAASTVMVGDRAHDVHGARAHGVHPVGALWGYGSREELVAAGATVLCERPAMLGAALARCRPHRR